MIELEDHDHGHCIDQILGDAQQFCLQKGLRLTDQRKAVLRALAESHVPASAYDVLNKLNKEREDEGLSMLAPVSIYRALEFLMENGIIHRIESRNAYVACTEHSGKHAGATIFLLCDKCGRAGEFQSEVLGELVGAISKEAQFQPHAPVMEIRGLCADCRKKDTETH